MSAATRDAATAVEQPRSGDAPIRFSGDGLSWPVQPGRPVRVAASRERRPEVGLGSTSSRSAAPRAL